MRHCYVDSSVALHAILPGQDSRAKTWLQDAKDDGTELVSSRILGLEIVRALRRDDLDLDLARPMLDRVRLVSLDDGVLRVAETIEPHVKALDSIHLATSLMFAPDVLMVSHDAAMRRAGELIGMPTFDPISPRPEAGP